MCRSCCRPCRTNGGPPRCPEDDAARVALLRASGVLTDPQLQQLFEQTAKRAAAIFDVPAAMVSFIDEQVQQVRGFHGELPAPEGSADAPVRYADQLDMPRSHSICGHVVAATGRWSCPTWRATRALPPTPCFAAKGLLLCRCAAAAEEGRRHRLAVPAGRSRASSANATPSCCGHGRRPHARGGRTRRSTRSGPGRCAAGARPRPRPPWARCCPPAPEQPRRSAARPCSELLSIS